MYALHVRRQVPSRIATLAFALSAVIGAVVAVGFVVGLIAMTIHYLS
jgi:hypothetical protein